MFNKMNKLVAVALSVFFLLGSSVGAANAAAEISLGSVVLPSGLDLYVNSNPNVSSVSVTLPVNGLKIDGVTVNKTSICNFANACQNGIINYMWISYLNSYLQEKNKNLTVIYQNGNEESLFFVDPPYKISVNYAQSYYCDITNLSPSHIKLNSWFGNILDSPNCQSGQNYSTLNIATNTYKHISSVNLDILPGDLDALNWNKKNVVVFGVTDNVWFATPTNTSIAQQSGEETPFGTYAGCMQGTEIKASCSVMYIELLPTVTHYEIKVSSQPFGDCIGLYSIPTMCGELKASEIVSVVSCLKEDFGSCTRPIVAAGKPPTDKCFNVNLNICPRSPDNGGTATNPETVPPVNNPDGSSPPNTPGDGKGALPGITPPPGTNSPIVNCILSAEKCPVTPPSLVADCNFSITNPTSWVRCLFIPTDAQMYYIVANSHNLAIDSFVGNAVSFLTNIISPIIMWKDVEFNCLGYPIDLKFGNDRNIPTGSEMVIPTYEGYPFSTCENSDELTADYTKHYIANTWALPIERMLLVLAAIALMYSMLLGSFNVTLDILETQRRNTHQANMNLDRKEILDLEQELDDINMQGKGPSRSAGIRKRIRDIRRGQL